MQLKTFRADLHCHSNCSDGSMSPEDLIFHAKTIGLSGISITDHDSINAYPRAIIAGQKAGIYVGAGVEFSSIDSGVSVHVLGYDFDLDNASFKELCYRHIIRRKNRNQKILEKLSEKGMQISLKEEGEKAFGRPHIALELVSQGYVANVQEAFRLWIGDGKPCFDPGVPISTDETISIIHQAKGKAFIAHPHLLRPERHISALLQKPFDGIECYYSKCNPDQEKKWIKIAQEKNLLISGGSDFHGDIKPEIPLGCSWVDQETFDRIFEKKQWK